MSDTLNKHNVFVTFERIILADSKNLKVEILLAELDALWYVGCEYRKGWSNVGDYGGGGYPSKNRDKPFTSRQAAVDYQLNQFEKDGRKELADAAKQFRQPKQLSLF